MTASFKVGDIFEGIQVVGLLSGTFALFIPFNPRLNDKSLITTDDIFNVISSQEAQTVVLIDPPMSVGILELMERIKDDLSESVAIQVMTNGVDYSDYYFRNDLVDFLTIIPRRKLGNSVIKTGDELIIDYPNEMTEDFKKEAGLRYEDFEHYFINPSCSKYINSAVNFCKENPAWRITGAVKELLKTELVKM